MSKTKYHLRYLILHLKALLPSLIEDLKPKPEEKPKSADKLLRDIQEGIYRPRTVRLSTYGNPLYGATIIKEDQPICLSKLRQDIVDTILSRRDFHHQHTDE